MCAGTRGSHLWALALSELEFQVVVKHTAWVLGAKLGSSKKQPEFLTAELSLRSHNCIFMEVLTLSVKDFVFTHAHFSLQCAPEGHN